MSMNKKLRRKYGKYVQRRGRKGKQPKSFAAWLEWRSRKVRKKSSSKRTIQDFVEDKISDGFSLKDIKTIAENTRWAPKTEEIMKEAEKFLKNLKKSFSKLLKKDDNMLS